MKRCELHTHLEGSVTCERLIKLAEKYGQPGLISACLNPKGDEYHFDGFSEFLHLFKHVTSVLRTPTDFFNVAIDLGAQLAADDVQYAEVTVSFGVWQKRNINPLEVQAVLYEAACQIEQTDGVVIRWIPDATRQWGVDAAWRAWEAAATCGRSLGVVGFGIGGDEAAAPAGEFAKLFAEVKSENMGVTIHAGELPQMGSAAADSVRQAVEECGADRIGHGLAAAADPLVMATLAARSVFVELCPRSNVKTGALANLTDFPLQEFLELEIPCCLNTDDRTLFGLDLNQEYAEAQKQLDLTENQIQFMNKCAYNARFDLTI